ncbi:MAG TPA: hypothetical protein PK078_15340, partial [Anaerolineales bacterium]|nr:hypothetical protein [Anaerolineales bacterium]
MSATATPPKEDKKEKKSNTLWQELLVPVLAVITGLIIGAIVILLSGENPLRAYGALFAGSFGTPGDLIQGLQSFFSSGDTKELVKAIYPFTESLVTATPYIFAGLSV